MPQRLKRRHLLASVAALALARPALAQSKPERLVFVGDPGAWKKILNEEQAPAFQKETGIRIEITQLPIDALNARLRSEFALRRQRHRHRAMDQRLDRLGAPLPGGSQKAVGEPQARSRRTGTGATSLRRRLQMGQFDGVQLGVPVSRHRRRAALPEGAAGAGRLHKPPETFDQLRDAAIACTKAGAPNRYGIGLFGKAGRRDCRRLPASCCPPAAALLRPEDMGNFHQQRGERDRPGILRRPRARNGK